MRRIVAVFILTSLTPVAPVAAELGRVTAVSQAPFAKAAQALEQAVGDHKMALVCHANAQRGAAGRGVAIKGNQVLMVSRNDFAVRLLAADPVAGFEAPIRIYVYENADGTATVSYTPPSRVFAPYAHPEVQKIAADPVRVESLLRILAQIFHDSFHGLVVDDELRDTVALGRRVFRMMSGVEIEPAAVLQECVGVTDLRPGVLEQVPRDLVGGQALPRAGHAVLVLEPEDPALHPSPRGR
jgi:uncharacterized protein (DUF302 family)